MDRIQKQVIQRDLEKKMVFLTGPRQVGKTTLAKSFASQWPNLSYLNWDADKDKLLILRQEWDRKAPLIILDEVHKLKKWKSRIKGVYDTEGIPPRILVTGSAHLDIFRRGGDSLAGRYFLHRMYPFSVRELRGQGKPAAILDQLMVLGGFPEPFLAQSELPIRLSRALSGQNVQGDDPLKVRVSKDGDVYLGAERVIRTDLEARLKAAAAGKAVLIEADRDAGFKDVVFALDAAERAGAAKVGVAVENPEPK